MIELNNKKNTGSLKLLSTTRPMEVTNMRDSQRSKVYKSDEALDTFGRLETTTAIQHIVNQLWASERFKKAFPRAAAYYGGPPKVEDGRRRRRACGNAYCIKMPKWSRTRGVIAHELAHTVCLRERLEGPWHGWQFCEVYLKLVLFTMGREAHDVLKQEFKKNRVRFREPVRRNLSPEERAAIGARLSVYRRHCPEDAVAA